MEVSDTQISQSPEHKNKSNKPKKLNNGRDRKNKSRRIVLIIGIFLILLIAFLVEFYDFETIFFKNYNRVFLFLSELIIHILFIKDKKNKVKSMKNHTDEDVWTNVIIVGKRVWKIFWYSLFHNALIFILLMIEISLFVGTFLGTKHIYSRTYYALKLFTHYEKQNTQEMIDVEMQKEDIANSDSGRKVLSHQDEATIKLLDNIRVSDNELNDVSNLSSADKNELFYLGGDYKINDWESEDEINNKVLQRVRDEIQKKRENVFDRKKNDEGAPQEICDRVSKLSEIEGKIVTLEEKKIILEEREDIFNMFPKGSLAKLIANDNQDIALILFFKAGNKKTVLYYYAQSIKYRHQIIRFKDIGNSEIKRRVNEIKRSYEDIEYIFSNDKECYYARKLKSAYQYAADQY